MRARGAQTEAVGYGIDLPPGHDGVFTINPSTGNITVGTNGSAQLVVRNKEPTIISFDVFAYFVSSGLNGNRVRL